MTVSSIIELNNRTLAFLKAQDFASAIESSSYALKYHKLVYSGAAPQSAPLCYSSGEDCLDQCMFLSEMMKECSSHEASHDTFLYNHGICVPSSVTDPSTVTPILIFNTALAHHLALEHAAGQHYTTLPATTWQKARRLYQLAYQSHDMDSNVLFQFALTNNIAMIDRRMGNVDSSTELLEYLMSLWMLLVDQGCKLRLWHVQGFLVNIPSASASAPAA